MRYILQNVSEEERKLIRSNNLSFRDFNHSSNDICTENYDVYKKIREILNK